MPGPTRAGALIYAQDLPRLSAFYQSLLTMNLLHGDAEHHVLGSPDFQLILHAIPPAIAATIEITVPPTPREEAALKLFFSVASLEATARIAQELGGALFADEWQGPGFRVRNGCDPEGNIFQLREWAT
jgi:catechol 2,3-dioxygenase-like lactoylglutathione lyase family enzyme